MRTRFRRRKGWITFLFIALVLSWVGGYKLYATSVCPRLSWVVMFGIGVVSLLIAVLYALIARDDSPIKQFMSALVLMAVVVGGTALIGGYLSKQESLRLSYCPAPLCQEAALAASLREKGQSQSAVDVASACLDKGASVSSECLAKCAHEKALGLFAEAGHRMQGLPKTWSEGKREQCLEIGALLKESGAIAKKYHFSEVQELVRERGARLKDMCVPPPPTLTPTPTATPTPTPTPVVQVEVLRARRSDKKAWIDFRVFLNGEMENTLNKQSVGVFVKDKPVDFEMEFRKEDDPVCVIAVVDNSGSIYKGLSSIRLAIRKLNDMRKPSDELGMVVFSSHDQIRVVPPHKGKLDPLQVTGSGELTALWDAVLKGVETSQKCSVPHRYIIVLTDGADNDSKHFKGDNVMKAKAVAQMAADKDISICTVGVQSSQGLEELPLKVAAYGCDYYPGKDFDEVANVFQKIFGYVRNFYRISFDPKDLKGPLVTLEVWQREVQVELKSGFH